MLAKKIAVGLGVAILLPLVIYFGVRSVVPAPEHDEYVKRPTYMVPLPEDVEERSAELQRREEEREVQEAAYDAAAKDFARALFYVSAPLGIIAILAGAIPKVPAVGAGLIFGGILSVTNGYVHYWAYLEDWTRFVSLTTALIVLLFIGYRQLAS